MVYLWTFSLQFIQLLIEKNVPSKFNQLSLYSLSLILTAPKLETIPSMKNAVAYNSVSTVATCEWTLEDFEDMVVSLNGRL